MPDETTTPRDPVTESKRRIQQRAADVRWRRAMEKTIQELTARIDALEGKKRAVKYWVPS